MVPVQTTSHTVSRQVGRFLPFSFAAVAGRVMHTEHKTLQLKAMFSLFKSMLLEVGHRSEFMIEVVMVFGRLEQTWDEVCY